MSAFKQKVISNFDAGAFYYDDYADVQKQIAIDLCHKIEGHPKTILEIGCGTGFLTEELKKKFPDVKILATDIAPNMVAKCQQKLKSDNITFDVIDGENITINQKFDLIISSMTFQWFEDLPKALEVLKRLLTAQGQIYFSLPNPQSFPEWHMVLQKNNIISGFVVTPINMGDVQTAIYQKQYKNALDFLHHIKKIGAHGTNSEHQNLNPMQLRKLCQQFDNGSREISWVIDFYKI